MRTASFPTSLSLFPRTVAQEVDREIVLEVLPDLFPSIEKRDPELSKNIMFEVVDLPRNTPGNDFEYKVSAGSDLHAKPFWANCMQMRVMRKQERVLTFLLHFCR